mgnify:CR=1 FL=1
MAAFGAELGFWHEWGAAVVTEFRCGNRGLWLGNAAGRCSGNNLRLGIFLTQVVFLLLGLGGLVGSVALDAGTLLATAGANDQRTADNQHKYNATTNHNRQVVLGKEQYIVDYAMRDIRLVNIDMQFVGIIFVLVSSEYLLVSIYELKFSYIFGFRSRRKCWCKGDALAPV